MHCSDKKLSEGSWSPHSRWLLCETPVPEERLVACLHFRFDAPADTAYVTCIAVDGEMQRQGAEDRGRMGHGARSISY